MVLAILLVWRVRSPLVNLPLTHLRDTPSFLTAQEAARTIINKFLIDDAGGSRESDQAACRLDS